ncbi:hypothetical protein WMF20_07130 [Sorangium sp. So ce834]|uniref:hypothetical protein n=1 Tax=Sorangium sp. So ce834 TaxID=3133321 RepID=UPI003F5ED4D1
MTMNQAEPVFTSSARASEAIDPELVALVEAEDLGTPEPEHRNDASAGTPRKSQHAVQGHDTALRDASISRDVDAARAM